MILILKNTDLSGPPLNDMAYKNQIISILILPKPSSPMMKSSENQISFIINFSHLSNILGPIQKRL